MVIRGRVPLRVSFGSNGTDMALFCGEQGGAIIGSAINRYIYCSIVPREDDQIVVHSPDFDMTVKYNTGENYVYGGKLDLMMAALNAMGIDQGCKMYLRCDAPPSSGLGTLLAVTVATLTAMTRREGVMMDTYALADPACQVKRLDLKIDRGYQNQYATTFGGSNFIKFHGRNNVVVNPLRIERDIIHELQYNLLLCYTGKIHVSANIIKGQVQNYEKRDAFKVMCEVKALAYALKDELLKGNLHSFGKLLDYGQQSKRRVNSKITNPQIGQLHDKALKAGTLGGKLLGTGGGGYLLMYYPYNVRHRVAARTEQADGQLADWSFGLRGAQSWVADEPRQQCDQMRVHTLSGEYRFSI